MSRGVGCLEMEMETMLRTGIKGKEMEKVEMVVGCERIVIWRVYVLGSECFERGMKMMELEAMLMKGRQERAKEKVSTRADRCSRLNDLGIDATRHGVGWSWGIPRCRACASVIIYDESTDNGSMRV